MSTTVTPQPRRTDNWAKQGNAFIPVGEVHENLPAGVYESQMLPGGRAQAKPIELVTDRIQTLKSSLPSAIIGSIEHFLTTEEKYKKLALLYKRGIMLHGPPGNGKTLTTLAIAHAMITKHDAVVFSGMDMSANMVMMKQIRKMQPERPILNIMEDLEVLANYVGDQAILNALDGSHQINKVIHLATTNYLKRLDPRYMGRPGRFDEVHMVGAPNEETVRDYVLGLLPDATKSHIEEIVKLADEMPMAYVKELVISVEVMGQKPEAAAKRLRTMMDNAKKANAKAKKPNELGEDMDYYDEGDDTNVEN